MLKFSSAVIWRLGTRSAIRKYSSTGVTVLKTDKFDSSGVASNNSKPATGADQENSGLVAAAFASLNNPESEEQRKPSPKSVKQSRQQQLDNQILKATDINSLLRVAEQPIVSRRHALKIVSILSEWSSSNRVAISDFEKDARFLKLCRILARSAGGPALAALAAAEDLSTVLGITGDDEAARLVMNLSLPQMIKVMKALQAKGRRSTPLLRAIAYNAAKQPDVIDLKKAADLLYCMAALNFPDPVLLDRICNDVIECLPSNLERPAAVGSICVSLGLLRWRHEPLLAALAQWLGARRELCRAADTAAAAVTLATLDYLPPMHDPLLEAAMALKEEEMVKPAGWLDLVFALLILDKASTDHLASTLQPAFIDKLLNAGEIPIGARRKLMCIDAYARLTAPALPRLPAHVAGPVPLLPSREKALYVHAVMDTFKSLVSADAFLKRDCDSGCGFLYDAEFAVDAKCHPVPLEKAAKSKNVFRIAVLGLEYHDMTRGTVVPLGVFQLYTRLLQLKGFKVLQIPYTEFNPKDKLVTRVQYIEGKLKELVAAV